LIKKIQVSEKANDIRVLELVKFHLLDEIKKDKEMKVGGRDYVRRLEAMERRLRGALIDKDNLVDNLSKELERAKVNEQQVKQAQQVITQEQEAAKKAGKTSIKLDIQKEDKKNKKQSPPPPPPGNP
jgi:hypothetical protein